MRRLRLWLGYTLSLPAFRAMVDGTSRRHTKGHHADLQTTRGMLVPVREYHRQDLACTTHRNLPYPRLG